MRQNDYQRKQEIENQKISNIAQKFKKMKDALEKNGQKEVSDVAISTLVQAQIQEESLHEITQSINKAVIEIKTKLGTKL